MWRRKFGNKYKNVRANYDGYTYASKKEAEYAFELDCRKKAGDIKNWGRQIRIPLFVGKYKICDYIVDFIINHNDGSEEYVEVKGMELPLWKLKWKIFEATYSEKPNVRISLIK